MNISTFKRTLPVLLRNNIVPFVWGAQGIGKSQSVEQVARDQDMGFVHLHLATQEVGDLVGLLVQQPDGTVAHARPEWLPTGGRGIIFLDELNRAAPDVIQAMFSFITSKTIHRHRLPAGWSIVAAGNHGDSFTVTDTSDAAWMSRFCHLTLEPDTAEFVTYLESRGFLGVADFVRVHPELTSKRGSKVDITITPDNRSYDTMIGPLEREELSEEVRFELYEGILGATAAISFMNFRRAETKRLKLATILTKPEEARKLLNELETDTVRFDLMAAPIDELVAKLTSNPAFLETEGYVANLAQYLQIVPLELLGQTVKKLGTVAFSHKMDLLNMPALVDRFRSNLAKNDKK